MSQKKDNNVTVGVRIRPRNDKELAANMRVFFNSSPDEISVQELDENGTAIKHWSFDRVFGPQSTNKEVFETMGQKLVDGALDGYNTVMFMYGQTSSGKTFTLFGGDGVSGVVDHAMEHVNHRVRTSADTEYVIKLTYAELYNEELRDLLSPTPNENLKIVEDPNLGPMIQNITEASFTSAADVKVLLDEGENRRHFGVTNMNAHSSRSHVIVRLCIESRRVPHKPANALRQSWGKDRPNCISTLNLVDLAGSERANKAGTSGQALKEGSYINKSLLTLGTVISNLSEGKTQHIPYRNSKLTRLLATALGGNAKTCVITCISPASGNLAESLNTLRFASRAKRIVNHVQRNEIMDMKSLTNKLAVQMAEIENLRNQLELSKQLGYVPDEDEQGTGESLRDKAVTMSKHWRSTRFLLQNGAKIMDGLRANGMKHLAKKVPKDIRAAITGARDITEVMEEYSTIITTYLSNDRPLLAKINEVLMNNETDTVLNMTNMFENLIAVDEDPDNPDMPLDPGQEFVDIFHLLESGGDEMKETLESSYFQREEYLMQFLLKYEEKLQEMNEILNREKLLKKNIEDLQTIIIEKNETIKSHKNNETFLHKQIEELQSKTKSEVKSFQDIIIDYQKKISQLELKLSDAETTIHMKSQEMLMKDLENEKFKNQIDLLHHELTNTQQSKKSIEEDSNRTRNEMRIQMERLRQNMHELLRQGGEEAKVIESHNVQLQNEIDTLKDEVIKAVELKQRFEMENTQLRSQLSNSLDELKGQYNTTTALRDENDDLTIRNRDLKIEITKLNARITVLDQSKQSIEHDLFLEKKKCEEISESKDSEIRSLQEKLRSKVNEYSVDVDIKAAEIESLNDQLNAKNAFISKLEQNLQADTSRLEKKLSTQSKLTEELTVENTNYNLQIQSLLHKHSEEVRSLKQKISDLQASIDTISSYIHEKEQELLDENLPKEEEKTEIETFHQRSLSKSSPNNQSSPYIYNNFNGNFLNNFNSYYDMSAMVRSPSGRSLLGSETGDENEEDEDNDNDHDDDDGESIALDSPSAANSSLMGRRAFFANNRKGAEDRDDDEQDNDDDDQSIVSNTSQSRSPRQATKIPADKMEKIKQFNEFYNSPPAHPPQGHDEFGIPMVHIDGSMSMSSDMLGGLASKGVTPKSAQKKANNSTPLSTTNRDGNTPNSTKVKFRSLSASPKVLPASSPSSANLFLSQSSSHPNLPLLQSTAMEQRERRFSFDEEILPSREGPFEYIDLQDPEHSYQQYHQNNQIYYNSHLQQHYQQTEQSFQEYYETISYGLQLSTLSYSVLYEQFREISQLITNKSSTSSTTIHSLTTSLDDYKISYENLYEKNEQLVQSLYYHQEKLSATELLLLEYEDKYCNTMKDINHYKNQEKLKENQISFLEENILQEKLKNEKLFLEIQSLKGNIQELKKSNLILMNDTESLQEKYRDLENYLDYIKQEKEILFVEREELMRRFLPALVIKPIPAAPSASAAVGHEDNSNGNNGNPHRSASQQQSQHPPHSHQLQHQHSREGPEQQQQPQQLHPSLRMSLRDLSNQNNNPNSNPSPSPNSSLSPSPSPLAPSANPFGPPRFLQTTSHLVSSKPPTSPSQQQHQHQTGGNSFHPSISAMRAYNQQSNLSGSQLPGSTSPLPSPSRSSLPQSTQLLLASLRK